METYATYCEYPKLDEYLELPRDLYLREWTHKDEQSSSSDPTHSITLDSGSRSFTLKTGLYLVRGFSSVTMMRGQAPITDATNAYPGCSYVYNIEKWKEVPKPGDAKLEEFLAECYAIGGIAVAMYSGSSIFECVVNAPASAFPTRIAVGHQVGYDPATAKNKVYARVAGGDSTYHLAAKISIYKMA